MSRQKEREALEAGSHEGGIVKNGPVSVPDYAGETIIPGRKIAQFSCVTSQDQAARLSRAFGSLAAAHSPPTMFGGPFFPAASVELPTKAERVRRLQAEANAGVVEMVHDIDKSLLALLGQVNELEGLKTPIVGIEAMVRELKPQIERWSIIVGGIAGKHKGR